MPASKKTLPEAEGSPSPSGITIIDRIAEAASAAEPESGVFAIACEAEAQNLLISIVGILRERAKQLSSYEDKAVVMEFVRKYILAVNTGSALAYIHQTEEGGDPIYVYGMKIIVSSVLSKLP